MINTTCACLVCLLVAEPKPAYVLESTPVQRIEAVLDGRAEHAGLSAREWILFAAKPPRLPSQVDVSALLEPAGRSTVERSSLKRAVLWARLPVRGDTNKSSIHVNVRYRATLMARRLVESQPSDPKPRVSPLTPKQRREALAETPLIDFGTEPFPRWLEINKLHRHDDEGTIDFARRIFLIIKRNFEYEYLDDMDRRASHVCRTRKSDCGGLCVVFVAVLRANRVPARLLVGRWAKSSKPGRTVNDVPYFETHVKAEFFADDVGWIPLDIACAINSKWSRQLKYFGNDPGDFLVMHLDDDLTLNTIHFGNRPVGLLQGISFWVVSTRDIEKLEIHERWRVRKLALRTTDADDKQTKGSPP